MCLAMAPQYHVGTWMAANLDMNIESSASFNTYGATGFMTLVLPRALVVFTNHSSSHTPVVLMSCLDAMVSLSPNIVLTTFSHTFFSTCIAFVQWRTRKYCTHFIAGVNVDGMQYFHNFHACASPYIQAYITMCAFCVCYKPTLKYGKWKKHDVFLTPCHLDGSSSSPATLSASSQVLYLAAHSNIFVVVGLLGCARDSILFPNVAL